MWVRSRETERFAVAMETALWGPNVDLAMQRDKPPSESPTMAVHPVRVPPGQLGDRLQRCTLPNDAPFGHPSSLSPLFPSASVERPLPLRQLLASDIEVLPNTSGRTLVDRNPATTTMCGAGDSP